jgi:hypothetical protein
MNPGRLLHQNSMLKPFALFALGIRAKKNGIHHRSAQSEAC